MWIDEHEMTLEGGHGGDGALSFRQEKCVEYGGPDGGNGGKGGDVIIEADRALKALINLRGRKQMKAEAGERGARSNRTGLSGKDLIVRVPIGTVVRRVSDNSVIADLVRQGERCVVAPGGRGGRGNKAYAGPTNRTPRYRELGEQGKRTSVKLEVRLMADIGLVGLPNAGKSTLLSRLSAARPRIADYPFTTLEPMLGVVEHAGVVFTMADLPGLIRGAHEGKGLGMRFLRHIERTRIILHLVDATSPTAADDYAAIREELDAYGHGLAEKRAIVALTKCDATADGAGGDFEGDLGVSVFKISAHSGQGLDELCYALAKLLDEIVPVAPLRSEIRIEEDELPVTVRRDGEMFILDGDAIRRYLERRAPEDYMAWRRFWRSLVRWGVADQLKELGIRDRDTVCIGDRVFEYLDEESGEDAATKESATKESATDKPVTAESAPVATE